MPRPPRARASAPATARPSARRGPTPAARRLAAGGSRSRPSCRGAYGRAPGADKPNEQCPALSLPPKELSMSLNERLAEHVAAAFTGIYVVSHEHHDALADIARLCRDRDWSLASWD